MNLSFFPLAKIFFNFEFEATKAFLNSGQKFHAK